MLYKTEVLLLKTKEKNKQTWVIIKMMEFNNFKLEKYYFSNILDTGSKNLLRIKLFK